MTRLRFPDPQDASRASLLETFAEAEASLRLEGMQPGSIFYKLKGQILAGEIGFDEAVAIVMANYPSNPPDADDWEDLQQYDPPSFYEFMESLDPMLRELAGTEMEAYRGRLAELQTVENFVALSRLHQERRAARQLAQMGGTEPDFPDIPRRRFPPMFRDDELVRQAQELTGITDIEALVRAALMALIKTHRPQEPE